MNKQQKQIEEEAKVAETSLENHDINALRVQLNAMPPSERLAVAKKLSSINAGLRETGNFGPLPSIELTLGKAADGKTDILSSLTDRDGAFKETLQYDQTTGKLLSETRNYPFGYTWHGDYDLATGKLKSARSQSEKDSYSQENYDTVTGKLKSREEHFSGEAMDHVTVRRTEYDLSTGTKKLMDETFSDHSTRHTEYNPITGQPLPPVKGKVDGSVLIDADTGEPLIPPAAALDDTGNTGSATAHRKKP